MQVKTEATIREKRNKSGTVSFRVDLGMVEGKRKQPTFPTREQALAFKRKADVEVRAKNPLALTEIALATRYSVLNALERLKPYGATLDEAVDFFIKHAKPPKPAVTFQEAIDEFVTIKAKAGLSQRYLDAATDYFNALRDEFKNGLVTEVDYKQAEGYIYDLRHAWNPTTRGNHLRHALLLYNFLIKRGYVSEGLNPFAKMLKPMQIEKEVTVLSVPDVARLLQYAFDTQAKAECACMALVLFCGVRVEEVAKLDWSHISLSKKRVEIPAAVAKKGRRRSNELKPNALSWLSVCHSEGKIAPPNFDNRLRAIRQQAGIKYPQNAMRHSFASYHVAAFKNAAETAMMLGHPNAVLLYHTYRDVVHHEDALKYWEIFPEHILKKEQDAVKGLLDEVEAAEPIRA